MLTEIHMNNQPAFVSLEESHSQHRQITSVLSYLKLLFFNVSYTVFLNSDIALSYSHLLGFVKFLQADYIAIKLFFAVLIASHILHSAVARDIMLKSLLWLSLYLIMNF